MKGLGKILINLLPTGWQQIGAHLINVADRLGNRNVTSPGLAIKGAGEPLAKAGSAFRAVINGRIIATAANTDMPALVGTVAADAFNVYAFFIDKAGTLTSAMGIAGATILAVKFPPVPVGKACIGWVEINPTGTGDFVGGTTDLDDATVEPNAVYVNVTGPFDPLLYP